MMATFEENATLAERALDPARIWAQEPLREMVAAHRRLELDLAATEEQLRAAQAREEQAHETAKLAVVERELERAAHTSTTETLEQLRADRLAVETGALAARIEELARSEREARAALEAELAKDLGARVTQLEQALTVLPGKYGHRGEYCDCGPCTYAREMRA
jgi:chromosome segregation ATPase